MKKYTTIAFWDYALERALKTAIQTLFAGGLIGSGLFDINPLEIASIAGGAVLASIGTSILSYKGDGTDSADTPEGQ